MRTEVRRILTKLNLIFNGKLIQVDLDEYVNKIINKATIISYNEKGRMCGFIAFYNNDFKSGNAYLTMLAIDPAYKGKGIGKLLLTCSIARLKQEGFKNYTLEVLKSNDKATYLYKRNGFTIIEESENHLKMILDICLL